MNPDEIEFLQHSNYIEQVNDSKSLDNAVAAWKYIKKQKELTEKNILKTHDILMKNHLDRPTRGNWRVVAVYIGGREGKPWWVLPELMNVWTMNANLFPENWKDHHVNFEKIHPFFDGNGRMGRILLNWQRLKAKLPILVIREEERFEYYKWFK